MTGETKPYETYTGNIGIDTGCGKNPKGTLTAFICNEDKFVTS